MSESDDSSDEYSDLPNDDIDIWIKAKKRDKLYPKDKNFYVFVVYLFQSIISIVCFFIYYKLQIILGGDNPIYEYIRWGQYIAIFLLLCYIINMCNPTFYKNHNKCTDIALFILINIFKIIFESCIFIRIGERNENNEVNYNNISINSLFSIFEPYEYWKVTISLFYLMLIFYCYFRKNKKSFKKFYILFAIISLAIIITFLFLAEKKSYIGTVFFFFFYEILVVFLAFWIDHKKIKNFQKDYYEDFYIKWKVNRLDSIRYLFIILIVINTILKFLKRSFI